LTIGVTSSSAIRLLAVDALGAALSPRRSRDAPLGKHRGYLLEVVQVRAAAAVRGPEAGRDYRCTGQRGDAPIQGAFIPGLVRPYIYNTRLAAQVVYVPVQFLSKPEVPGNPSGKAPAGAADIDVVSGREKFATQPSNGYFRRAGEFQHKTIQTTARLLRIISCRRHMEIITENRGFGKAPVGSGNM